jgi:hypothetical protein
VKNFLDEEGLLPLVDISSEEQRAVKLLRLAHSIITQCKQENRLSSWDEEPVFERVTQWLANQGIIFQGSGE